MEKVKKRPRKSDKDVFLAEELSNSAFDQSIFEFPIVPKVDVNKPLDVVLWSERNGYTNCSNLALAFYEYDCRFDGRDGIYSILKTGTAKQKECLFQTLKRFAFVVCPDYSLYGDFPNYRHIDAVARSREVGAILNEHGIPTIINYRALRSWFIEPSLVGIEQGQIVSVGTVGCLKDSQTRKALRKSIEIMIMRIRPRAILVYGKAPDDIFGLAKLYQIKIWQFDSKIAKAFEGRAKNGYEE